MNRRLSAIIVLAALLGSADASSAFARDKSRDRDDGRAWRAQHVFRLRNAEGQMRVEQWQVIRGSQRGCEEAAYRADAQIPYAFPGWRMTGSIRKSPCRMVLTRSGVR